MFPKNTESVVFSLGYIFQVALRYQLERLVCVAPKSAKKERMEQNFAALDFSLDEQDMKDLEACDSNYRLNAE